MKADVSARLFTAAYELFPWCGSELIDALWEGIEEPPTEVDALLSSSLPFKIAATAKRAGHAQELWDPLRIAEALAAVLTRDGRFAVTLSFRGHLNIKATPRWYGDFLSALVAQGGNSLVSTQHYALAESLAGLELRPLAEAPPSLAARWAEDEALLHALGIENVIDAQSSAGRDVLLMLLASLANPELDSQAFTKNLYSRENLPWLLRNFSKSWRTVAATPASIDFVAAAAERVRQPLRAWKEEVFCAEALYWLAVTRGNILWPIGRPCPVSYYSNLCRHLLCGVDLFFCFYNHPQNRQRASEHSRGLLRLIGEAVEAVDKALFLPKSLSK